MEFDKQKLKHDIDFFNFEQILLLKSEHIAGYE